MIEAISVMFNLHQQDSFSDSVKYCDKNYIPIIPNDQYETLFYSKLKLNYILESQYKLYVDAQENIIFNKEEIQARIIISFANKIIENTKSLDRETSELLQENFWDLI